jgi:hypothetical protein
MPIEKLGRKLFLNHWVWDIVENGYTWPITRDNLDKEVIPAFICEWDDK